MDVEYLTIGGVERIHDLVLDRDGGIRGRHPGKLEAKLALPMSGFGDYERFPTIAEKAAAYLYEFAVGHCFMDGNKRTAYAATFMFLDINGFELICEDDEVVSFVSAVANDETRPSFKKVVDWIKEHIHECE
ncbi:type II toxin-antitoxin system death-on-curing family toxin [Lentibacillus sp. N15]|uniref:type II toxin-antitoxin system death-on-curing family toxin n=1 Tax=Lentibacillus songyuanensis TaxID=3136161 RepID=UPI0031BA0F98